MIRKLFWQTAVFATAAIAYLIVFAWLLGCNARVAPATPEWWLSTAQPVTRAITWHHFTTGVALLLASLPIAAAIQILSPRHALIYSLGLVVVVLLWPALNGLLVYEPAPTLPHLPAAPSHDFLFKSLLADVVKDILVLPSLVTLLGFLRRRPGNGA